VTDLLERVVARGEASGCVVSAELASRLVAYLQLLASWNRRVNLTSFDLSPPSDGAIDRLLVESLMAASLVRANDRRALDIGSGGGSPAVPLMLAVPTIEMVLVEVRAKKAAFLREVVRSLSLRAVVEVARVEDVAASERAGRFDLISLRAVRADRGIWRAVDELLKEDGRVLWFGGVGQSTETNLTLAGSVGSVAAFDR
jgi:16S rRNA (guanine527-N7)-methyltransferase